MSGNDMTAWERSKANMGRSVNAGIDNTRNGLASAYNAITDGNGVMGLIPGINQQRQWDRNAVPVINDVISSIGKAGTRTNAQARAAGVPHLGVLPAEQFASMPMGGPLNGLAGMGQISPDMYNPGMNAMIDQFGIPGGMQANLPGVAVPFAGVPSVPSTPIEQDMNDYGGMEDVAVETNSTPKQVAKAIAPNSQSKPKSKKAKNKQKAIRSQVTKDANKQQAAINAAAGGASFATVDPLNIFGNRNGANPFNPNIKGSNRFSGGAVQGGKMSQQQSDILDMF